MGNRYNLLIPIAILVVIGALMLDAPVPTNESKVAVENVDKMENSSLQVSIAAVNISSYDGTNYGGAARFRIINRANQTINISSEGWKLYINNVPEMTNESCCSDLWAGDDWGYWFGWGTVDGMNLSEAGNQPYLNPGGNIALKVISPENKVFQKILPILPAHPGIYEWHFGDSDWTQVNTSAYV